MVSDFLGSVGVRSPGLEFVAEAGDVVVDLIEPGDSVGLECDLNGVLAGL